MRIPQKSLDIIRERSQGRCEACGGKATNTHHRLRRGMGGSALAMLGSPSNLLRLCGSGTAGCHGFIEHSRTIAYDLGLLVHSGQNPAGTPVQLFIPGIAGWDLPALCRVLLTDDGRYLPVERNVA